MTTNPTGPVPGSNGGSVPGTPGSTGSTGGTGTTDTAKQEAGQVASTAAEGGQRVAETAKDQGQRVVSEATDQARNLVEETRSQIQEQAGTQQQRAAKSLRQFGDDLQSMAGSGEQSGVAGQLVLQASQQMQDLAGWLESRDPQGLLGDVRGFARRRPGVFLLGAAVAGLAAGRLTRAGVDQARQDSGPTGPWERATTSGQDSSGLAPAAATARGAGAGAVGYPTGGEPGSPEGTATTPTGPPVYGTSRGTTSPTAPVGGEHRAPDYRDMQEPPR